MHWIWLLRSPSGHRWLVRLATYRRVDADGFPLGPWRELPRA